MPLLEFHNTLLSNLKIEISAIDRFNLGEIAPLNSYLFGEQRIINTIDHEHIIALILKVDGIRAGFKIGYGISPTVFYSAKGGIMPAYRRKGFARLLTKEMATKAFNLGYETLEYDTFPNKGPEMLFMGLKDGFKITDAGWNDMHCDFRIHLSVSISEYLHGTYSPDGNDPG
jgi:GNAT superfamily N-acetyltransferase